MRNSIVIACVLFVLSACSKIGEKNLFQKEVQCPTVSADALPTTLRSTFSEKYPSASSVTWYDTDGKGFCAVFENGTVKTRAMFDRTGTFISERTGDHKDCGHAEESGGQRQDGKCEHHRRHHPPRHEGCECGSDND